MPIMVRYAWHDAGTYDKVTKTGGADGSIRFDKELGHGANAGLAFSRSRIAEFKSQFPSETYADLIQAGGYTAVSYAGGPNMAFRFGRVDATEKNVAPEGRLPDAN